MFPPAGSPANVWTIGSGVFFGSNAAMTAAVALRKQPPYDPLKDFTPIALVGRATFVYYVTPSVPAQTLQEFVAYARANTGKLNYGTGNPQSILAMQQLMNAALLSGFTAEPIDKTLQVLIAALLYRATPKDFIALLHVK